MIAIEPNLTIQKASAGSGKTQLLATSYLKILLDGIHQGHLVDPRSIIATTFTREAAGEILRRIIKLLASAVEDRQIRSFLELQTGCSSLDPQLLVCLLYQLLELIDQLSIGTIDAFLGEQAKALGALLGLAPHWEIANPIELKEMSQSALIQLLERVPEAGRWWRQLHYFGRPWNILQHGGGLLERYHFLATCPLLSFSSHNAQAIPSAHKQMESWEEPRFLSEQERYRLQQELSQLVPPCNAKGKPSGYWQKAQQDLIKLLEQPLLWRDLALQGGVLRPLTEEVPEPLFYRIAFPLEWRRLLEPLVCKSLEEHCRLHHLREVALHHLLAAYHHQRSKVALARGKYSFQEIEQAFCQRDKKDLFLEELLFSLEGRLGHLLLDEYQDTNQTEHQFFEPLIAEVLAKGGQVLLVGDLKQAIYRWRGGRRGLLDELEKKYPRYLKPTPPLDKSYRSSPDILKFVNELFGYLEQQEWTMPMGEAFHTAARRWSQEFHPHQAAARVAELEGEVTLLEHTSSLLNMAEGVEERQEHLLTDIVERVKKHLQIDPERQIAILLRRNHWIPRLLERCREEGIVATGQGGNNMLDTAAGRQIAAFCEWIRRPNHQAAYQLLCHSPLAIFLEKEGGDPNFYRQQLSDDGYGPTLSRWVELYQQVGGSAYEQARLEQLLVMAYRFDQSGSGNITDWVEILTKERVELPLAGGVRILTIHAAKGLEFETVLLADLESAAIAPKSESFSLAETTEGEVYIPANRSLMGWLGRTNLYDKEQEEGWLEALSILYVGVTRAIRFLDIFLERAETSSKRGNKSLGGWLRLLPLQEKERKEKIVYSSTKQNIKPLTQLSPSRQLRAHEKERFSLESIMEEALGGCLLRRPSQPESFVLGDLLTARFPALRSQALEEGLFLHALLSQITWLEEEKQKGQKEKKRLIEKAMLLESAKLTHLSIEECFSLAENLFRKIELPPWSSFFQQEAYLEAWQSWKVTTLVLWQERAFSLLNLPVEKSHPIAVKKEILLGRWDRVVLGYREGEAAPIIAEVIDFKRGDRELARYQDQLRDYEIALRRLLPSLESVSGRLLSFNLT